MLQQILSWIRRKVKRCVGEHCGEPIFRDGPLCFDCFLEEDAIAWRDHMDEVEYAHLVSVGRG